MNSFSKSNWENAVRKATSHPEKASIGWLIVGIILVLAVLKVILFL